MAYSSHGTDDKFRVICKPLEGVQLFFHFPKFIKHLSSSFPSVIHIIHNAVDNFFLTTFQNRSPIWDLCGF